MNAYDIENTAICMSI